MPLPSAEPSVFLALKLPEVRLMLAGPGWVVVGHDFPDNELEGGGEVGPEALLASCALGRCTCSGSPRPWPDPMRANRVPRRRANVYAVVLLETYWVRSVQNVFLTPLKPVRARLPELVLQLAREPSIVVLPTVILTLEPLPTPMN